MTRDNAILRVVRLRALSARPGTEAEGSNARRVASRLMAEHEITEAEITDRIALDTEAAGGTDEPGRPSYTPPRPGQRRPPAPAHVIIADHRKHPSRVHMAINTMQAVCGVGPTFVWTFTREIAFASGVPCPHCLDTGAIDARREPRAFLPPIR